MSSTLPKSLRFAAAGVVAVALIFGGVFAISTAQAQALTEDQITSILSLLNSFGADATTVANVEASLRGQATPGGGSGTTGGTGFTFTRNHSQGDSGGEVMEIQKFLNNQGFTVSSSGAGSPGSESSYFGALTKAAVIKFQNAYASEILTPVGLSAGTGYWGPSSRAKANALNAGGTPGTPGTPTTGNITVSSTAQPANSLAVAGAARVPFTRFTLTNGTNAAVTVNGIMVQRQGLATDANFASVVLLDGSGNQIGNSQILNSNHQATIGGTFTVPANSTVTYTVAGNVAASGSVTSGAIASIAVTGINSGATIAGSLPIVGASHTMNNTLTLGTVTAARGSLDPAADDASEEVGTLGKTFSSIKLTAGSQEDIRVNSIRWNQAGSAGSSDLANVIVMVDGTSYPAVVSSDGKYYTASFGSGIVITKGLSKEFTVKADIVGGAGRTASFNIYRATDINVVGQTYGYGLTPNDGNSTTEGTEGTFDDESTPAYDAYDVTISAGSISSVSRSDAVPTGNVAEQVANTNLGAFSVTIAGEAITVQTVKFGTQISGGPDASDLTNVTLVDQNGAVLAGPVDGAADGFESTGDTSGEGSISFSSVTFPVGTTVITVKGQLSTDFDATDTLQITVNPTDWTGATGQTTGNNITFSSSLATANTQTVKAASLSATTLTQPAARSIVGGSVDFIFMTGLLDATDSGEDIRVTAIEVTDSGTGDVNDIDNAEIWADLTSANSARGDKYETKVTNTTQFSATTTNMSLTTLVTVPKNTSVEVALIADLNSSAHSGSTHLFDIGSTNGVTGSGVTTGNSASDTSPSGSGQAMTVSGGGSLTVTLDSSTPLAQAMLDNTSSEQTLSVFNFNANNVEDIEIDSIVLDPNSSGATTSVSSFKIYKGTTLIQTVVNTGAATLTANIPDGALIIPANSDVDITVKAVMNNIDGTIVKNGKTIQLNLSTTSGTGKGSGSTITDAAATGASTHELYEGYPTFAFDNTNVGTVLGTSENYLVAKIVVSNPGDKDVKFITGDDNNLTLQVNSSSDDTDTALETITIKNQAGTTLDSFAAWQATTTSEVSFDFSSATFTVPAGGSDTIFVYATTDHEDDGDTLQVWLDDTDADVDFAVGDVDANYEVGAIVLRGDLFGPSHVNP